VVTIATLEIPQEVLGVLGTDPACAAGEIRLLAAMKLFELGRLSSGSAAALAGVARVELLAKLGEYGVSPFQVSPEDLEQDLENARRADARAEPDLERCGFRITNIVRSRVLEMADE
jgi:predicted HTH domain antitoxin